MHDSNVNRILEMLEPKDIVLDIGGWARPFNRANYVMDSEPYESRGFLAKHMPAQGGEQECFSVKTWIQRDICERTPFPFSDKSIDFVICSHTLEDVRDPLWVCSEMIRIGKRGYIETPSRVAESSRGIEPRQVGWSHHRWLVEIEQGSIRFLMKYHLIHSHWKYSFPQSFYRKLEENQKVHCLFWENSFLYSEIIIHGVENIAKELERYVKAVRPYSNWRLALATYYDRSVTLIKRGVRKVTPTLY